MIELDPLTKLANLYSTDKAPWCHNYTPLYHYLLNQIRQTARKVLEIGVFDGASVKMWHDYFPNAIVWGIDIHDHHCINPEQHPRIRFTLGDATSTSIRERIWREVIEAEPKEQGLDLIVDDGSHYPAEVRTAYFSFFPLLREGAYYIIEDMAPLSNGDTLWINRASRINRMRWDDDSVLRSVEANKW